MKVLLGFKEKQDFSQETPVTMELAGERDSWCCWLQEASLCLVGHLAATLT